MTMRFEQLLEVFREAPLTEIYVPGFVDDGGGSNIGKSLPHRGVVFHPMSDDVYLEFGERMVRCRTIDQYSRMIVVPATQFECSFDIDPDDTFGVIPLLRMALQSGRDSAKVLRFDAFIGEGFDAEQCVFAALGLALDSEDYIFLDPLDYNGIHIGAIRARDIWLSYWGARYFVSSRELVKPQI
jgi:hypothetical protein